ncbi:1842_t:CDS:1, partial [Paraglomus brasilianum]
DNNSALRASSSGNIIDNNSALCASSSDALVYYQICMLTVQHYVPHPRSIFECNIQNQDTNTTSTLRASNLALIEELTRKLGTTCPVRA